MLLMGGDWMEGQWGGNVPGIRLKKGTSGCGGKNASNMVGHVLCDAVRSQCISYGCTMLNILYWAEMLFFEVTIDYTIGKKCGSALKNGIGRARDQMGVYALEIAHNLKM